MDFDSIIRNRRKEIDNCRKYIDGLEKAYKEKVYEGNKNKLIRFLEEKRDLLISIDEDDFDTLPQKLESIDKKIS